MKDCTAHATMHVIALPSASVGINRKIGECRPVRIFPFFQSASWANKFHQRHVRERWQGCGKRGKMGLGKMLDLSQVVPVFFPFPTNFTHFPYISHRVFLATSHNSPCPPIFLHFPPFFPHSPHSPPFPPTFPPFSPFLFTPGAASRLIRLRLSPTPASVLTLAWSRAWGRVFACVLVFRGLLCFADAKPLGPRGLRWLYIHCANTCGKDKISFNDRFAFIKDQLPKVLPFDPLNCFISGFGVPAAPALALPVHCPE